jgi:uncharacterized protein (TIGR02147 family)
MLGFASPNYLRLILNGEKNLGDKSIQMIAQAFALKKKEKDYFYNLVKFNQEKDEQKKNTFFLQLSHYSSRSTIVKLTCEHCEYFKQWYYPVVREIICDCKEPLEYDSIGERIRPQITGAKVKKSVELLIKLGFVAINNEGVYKKCDPVIKTDNYAMMLAVKNYHKAIIDLAGKAVDECDSLQQELSAVTAKISKKGVVKLKSRIQSFREELLQIITEDQDVDRIYQINLHMYPVSISDCE